MNQPKPKIADSSIDDMLTSIRDAIHEETAREAEEHARTFKTRAQPGNLKSEPKRAAAPVPPAGNRTSSVSGSMRELRVSLQPAGQTHSRGTVTARSEDFLSLKNKLASLRQTQPAPATGSGNMASIMGGDVRLEEAIERMNTAEQLQRQNAPVPPPAEARVEPEPEPPADVPIRGAAWDEQPDMAYEPQETAPAPQEAMPEPELEMVEPEPTAPEIVEMPLQPEPLLAAAVVQEISEPEEPVYQELGPAPVEQAVSHTQPEAPSPVRPIPVAPVSIEPEPVETAQSQPAVVLPRADTRLAVQAELSSMMSGDTARAASHAFDRLSDELFSRTSAGAQVLEDSARDMIKPMLKSWLDDNLPSLVERLVREEIERVVRKGGR